MKRQLTTIQFTHDDVDQIKKLRDTLQSTVGTRLSLPQVVMMLVKHGLK